MLIIKGYQKLMKLLVHDVVKLVKNLFGASKKAAFDLNKLDVNKCLHLINSQLQPR